MSLPRTTWATLNSPAEWCRTFLKWGHTPSPNCVCGPTEQTSVLDGLLHLIYMAIRNINQRKCEASFSVNPQQANLQPKLLLFNSLLCFNPTPTFFGVTFDCTLSFSKHVSSLKAKFFAGLTALCCISASSCGPYKEALSLSLFCIKLLFGPFSLMFHPDGFLS